MCHILLKFIYNIQQNAYEYDMMSYDILFLFSSYDCYPALRGGIAIRNLSI